MIRVKCDTESFVQLESVVSVVCALALHAGNLLDVFDDVSEVTLSCLMG